MRRKNRNKKGRWSKGKWQQEEKKWKEKVRGKGRWTWSRRWSVLHGYLEYLSPAATRRLPTIAREGTSWCHYLVLLLYSHGVFKVISASQNSRLSFVNFRQTLENFVALGSTVIVWRSSCQRSFQLTMAANRLSEHFLQTPWKMKTFKLPIFMDRR